MLNMLDLLDMLDKLDMLDMLNIQNKILIIKFIFIFKKKNLNI